MATNPYTVSISELQRRKNLGARISDIELERTQQKEALDQRRAEYHRALDAARCQIQIMHDEQRLAAARSLYSLWAFCGAAFASVCFWTWFFAMTFHH